jgi:hypothetical protein
MGEGWRRWEIEKRRENKMPDIVGGGGAARRGRE